MLPHDATSYDDLSGRFRWEIPDRFNIGVAICDDWAAREPNREALVYTDEDGSATSYTYGDLRRLSNQLANLLTARGVQPGDRIGVLMPQRPETAFAHIAALKLGAITIPLFTLFGEEALEYRLKDSGAKAVITDASGAAKLATIRDRLPELTTVLCADEDVPGQKASIITWPDTKAHSTPSTQDPMTRQSSSTLPAPPDSPRVPCTATGCCSAICRASR